MFAVPSAIAKVGSEKVVMQRIRSIPWKLILVVALVAAAGLMYASVFMVMTH